jgi:hypothetical protein
VNEKASLLRQCGLKKLLFNIKKRELGITLDCGRDLK